VGKSKWVKSGQVDSVLQRYVTEKGGEFILSVGEGGKQNRRDYSPFQGQVSMVPAAKGVVPVTVFMLSR